MFKRGEVVFVSYNDEDLLDGVALCIGKNKYLWITQDGSNAEGEWEATGSHATFTPYPGPIYEKGEQRFVPSGAFREPVADEYYYSMTRRMVLKRGTGFLQEHTINKTFAIILLPIPALPDEHAVADKKLRGGVGADV